MSNNFNELFEIVTVKSQNKSLLQYQRDNVSDYNRESYFEDYYRHSIYSLLKYKRLNKYVGMVGMVLPDPDGKKKLLPIEIVLSHHLAFDKKLAKVPRQNTAEVFAISVSLEFRPKLAFMQLLRAVIKMSLENKITNLYAAFNADVERVLTRLGLNLQKIIAVVEYHGKRRCYYGAMQSVIEDIYCSKPLIWELISDKGRLIPDLDKIICPIKRNEENESYNFL